jgi:hypothetical protein
MKPTYKMLYLVVEGLELLKATWQTEAESLDAARDADRLGELGNDLALLDITLQKFKADRDAIAREAS